MLASIALALSSAWAHGPQVPVLTYVSGGEHPVISDAQRAASGGILGFEGGRVVKQQSDGSYWLFTAEFKGPRFVHCFRSYREIRTLSGVPC